MKIVEMHYKTMLKLPVYVARFVRDYSVSSMFYGEGIGIFADSIRNAIVHQDTDRVGLGVLIGGTFIGVGFLQQYESRMEKLMHMPKYRSMNSVVRRGTEHVIKKAKNIHRPVK